MRKLLIFLLITTIGPRIVLSQIIDFPETVNDSLTISREQANEVANGLVNEGRLKVVYKQLKKENKELEGAYLTSSKRNIRFKDTIIPTLEAMVKVKEEQIKLNKGFTNSLEASLKKQKRKKWTWLGIGAGGGAILALILSQ